MLEGTKMKIFEFNNIANPTAQVQPTSAAPAQDPKAKAGAAAVSRALGGKVDVKFAQAIDKAEQGKSLPPALLKSIAPFAGALEKIFANPAMRTKFLAMVKSVQAEESVTEDRGGSVDAVASSVTNRIMRQHVDLLSKYGPVKVMAAINDVAEFAGSDELDEIGSSDVSGWVKQVVDGLEAGHFDHVDENAEIDRVRKLAGLPATEGMVDIEYGVDPKLKKLVDIGHLLRKTLDVSSGVKWDDADFNKTANLADALISLGATFGPKNLKDALKLADIDIAQAKDLIAKASQRAPVDEVSDKTLSSYTDKAAKERDAYHADRNKDAESARKYYNRKAGVRKALSITQEDQLDELSPQTLGSYVSKSVADEKERRARGIRVRDELRAATGMMLTSPMDRKLHSPTASRKAGQKRAIDKLTGASKVPAKEGYYTPGPETMPGAVGPQENTTVSFNQSKTIGDATLNINASAKDMEELHRILKLAGIDYNSNGDKQEPSMKDVAVALAPHAPKAPAEEPCGCDDAEVAIPMVSGPKPLDLKYTTDKTALINAIKDKLAQRLS